MKSILEGREALRAELGKVAEVAGYLWQKGWAERNGGNITVNITHLVDGGMREMPPLGEPLPIGTVLPRLRGLYFYCKGTGKRMRDLARDPMCAGSIIRVCDDCASYEIIADSPIKPTSELASHLSLQDYLIGSGSSYKATLHTHPIELVAMSHNPSFLDSKVLTRTLWSMIPETLAFAPLGIGVVPYNMPGSVELADATTALIKEYDVVLWEKHGTLAVGEDIIEAFDSTDVLNKAACIYMTGCNMGFIPEGMTDKAMEDIRKAFSLPDKREK